MHDFVTIHMYSFALSDGYRQIRQNHFCSHDMPKKHMNFSGTLEVRIQFWAVHIAQNLTVTDPFLFVVKIVINFVQDIQLETSTVEILILKS